MPGVAGIPDGCAPLSDDEVSVLAHRRRHIRKGKGWVSGRDADLPGHEFIWAIAMQFAARALAQSGIEQQLEQFAAFRFRLGSRGNRVVNSRSKGTGPVVGEFAAGRSGSSKLRRCFASGSHQSRAGRSTH